MRTLLGTEGGTERVILCVRGGLTFGFYLAVHFRGRYYRIWGLRGLTRWGVGRS